MARAWDRFFYTPADSTTLGLIRICCGLVTLYVYLVHSFDLQSLFGENAWMDLKTANEWRHEVPVVIQPGNWDAPQPPLTQPTPEQLRYWEKWNVDPRMTYAQGHAVWSIWFHVTDPDWMAVVHVVVLVSILLFTVGFCTRVTSWLTWVGAISYLHRAPTFLFGQDAIQMVLLYYLSVGYLFIPPSRSALSLDRLLYRWRVRRQRAGNRHVAGEDDSLPFPVAPSVAANFVIRLMQIHFCIIYLASGTSKLLGSTWWQGTATYLTMANYEFAPLDVKLYADWMAFMARHRWMFEVFMTGGTFFTLFLEIGFPFLVWNRRLRPIMLILSVMLHVGIAVFMGLTGFGLMMITLLLAFVPSEAVRRWIEALNELIGPLLKSPGFQTSKPVVEGARA
jgi:hypothetical protein